MKISCVICAGTVQEDYFVAAPCGHTFHHTCLNQWLLHQKSCPQCREKCLPRQIIRLFLDDANASSSLTQFDSLSSNDLKEQLQEQDQLNKQKDEALRITKQELESVREELKAWQAQYDGAQYKIDKEKALNQSLKHQVQMLQTERDFFEKKAKEVDTLKEKITIYQKIELLLTGNKEDAQEVVSGSCPNSLSNYVIALKGDYDSLKQRKAAIQKEKDKYFEEITDLRRKLRSRDLELQKIKSNLNTVTSDLQSYEVEKDNLKKKVQLLEKALESPNSRATFQRILESPMPDAVLTKKRKIDIEESSPLLIKHEQEKENRQTNMFTDKELSNSDDAPVLLPVQKMSARNPYSSSLSSGFNGFGGHSKVIVSNKTKYNPPQATNRRPFSKFVPRSSTISSSSSKNKLITKLNF